MDNLTGENIMTCNEFTLRTADIQEIFYFNSYNIGEKWEDFPARMVDGLMYEEGFGYSVAATSISNNIQWCDENSSPTDRSTSITKIEIRVYSGIQNSCGTLIAYIRPNFTAGDGDTHSWIPPAWQIGSDNFVPPAWSEWFDITNDTNTPSTWTWSDINNLDVDHWMVRTVCGNPDRCYTGRIEIRVTWHDSVTLSKPLPNSLDNKLDKQLKSFNLWRDYKLHDEGISGQPLNFTGVEIGIPEGFYNIYGTCFPLCFPICFDQIVESGWNKSAAQVAQEKFAKIHNWMENNYNILLNEFGDCFNAEYAIRNFTVESMKHPSNYLWKLTLEKAGN